MAEPKLVIADGCEHCNTALGYEPISLCRDCEQVFHADGCLDLHFCSVRRQKDEEKLAAWVAASENRDD